VQTELELSVEEFVDENATKIVFDFNFASEVKFENTSDQ
jgi:hypothetical protein